MAKTQLNAKEARAAHARVETAIAAIKKFHKQGQKSRADHPERLGYQAGKLAKAANINPDTLRKARDFAHEYKPDDLDRLFARCREHQSPLFVGHVIRLITLGRKQRLRLELKAIKGRWSKRQLDEDIRKICGNRRAKSGRLPRVPQDVAGIRVELRRISLKWERMYAAMREQTEAFKKLSRLERQAMKKVDNAMGEVTRKVSTHLPSEPKHRVPTKLIAKKK